MSALFFPIDVIVGRLKQKNAVCLLHLMLKQIYKKSQCAEGAVLFLENEANFSINTIQE